MSRNINLPVLLIVTVIDYIWLKSSYGKVMGGKFVSSMEGVLKKFASENPYPFVKSFLETMAIPNAPLFGFLTMWGEVLVALSLLVSLVILYLGNGKRLLWMLLSLGLFGGAFLNAIFYLSAGWTSPSSESLNLLMFAIEVIVAVYVLRVFLQKT